MRRLKFLSLTAVIICLLGACNPSPVQEDSTIQTAQSAQYLTGWQEKDGQQVYILEDGSLATGWLESDGKRYYFDQSGILQTGWLEMDGSTYYLSAQGCAVTGEAEIDGKVYHFTSQGQRVLLVNPWNALPADYQPELVRLSDSISSKEIFVEKSCLAALEKMIADCNSQCPSVCVISGHRTNDYQKGLYNRKVNYYLEQGYSEADAKIEAAKVVAVPGTSEHQLGLAVDIIDTRSWSLTEIQETLPAQQWLMKNCWRYGFILRYPKDKTKETGIIYEPWHYRYVGESLAKELYDSGLTLEEYLQSLTAQ